MLSFLRNTLRGRPAQGGPSAVPPLPPIRGNDTVRFDPSLVAALTMDHRRLQDLFKAIGEEVGAGRYADVKIRLAQLWDLVHIHHMQEDVRLYSFIEGQIAVSSDMSRAEDAEMLRDLRREMNSHAHTVREFARKYLVAGVTAENLAQFTDDYDAAGVALTSRIEREESQIFGLYLHYGH